MFSCVASEWFHLRCGFAKNHPVSAACAPRCLHCQAKPITNRTRWLTSLGGSHRLVSSHPSRGFSVVYLSCLFFFFCFCFIAAATTQRLQDCYPCTHRAACTCVAGHSKQFSPLPPNSCQSRGGQRLRQGVRFLALHTCDSAQYQTSGRGATGLCKSLTGQTR